MQNITFIYYLLNIYIIIGVTWIMILKLLKSLFYHKMIFVMVKNELSLAPHNVKRIIYPTVLIALYLSTIVYVNTIFVGETIYHGGTFFIFRPSPEAVNFLPLWLGGRTLSNTVTNYGTSMLTCIIGTTLGCCRRRTAVGRRALGRQSYGFTSGSSFSTFFPNWFSLLCSKVVRYGRSSSGAGSRWWCWSYYVSNFSNSSTPVRQRCGTLSTWADKSKMFIMANRYQIESFKRRWIYANSLLHHL